MRNIFSKRPLGYLSIEVLTKGDIKKEGALWLALASGIKSAFIPSLSFFFTLGSITFHFTNFLQNNPAHQNPTQHNIT
jgi:hypothetical protein